MIEPDQGWMLWMDEMSEQMHGWLGGGKSKWRQAAWHEQKEFDKIVWHEMNDCMADMSEHMQITSVCLQMSACQCGFVCACNCMHATVCVRVCVHVCVCECKHQYVFITCPCVHVCLCMLPCLHAWMDGWTDRWMDGHVSGCRGGCEDACPCNMHSRTIMKNMRMLRLASSNYCWEHNLNGTEDSI